MPETIKVVVKEFSIAQIMKLAGKYKFDMEEALLVINSNINEANVSHGVGFTYLVVYTFSHFKRP